MKELVLLSKAKHCGNEEVVLVDGEHDIKGYSGNSYMPFFVRVCEFVFGVDSN